MDIRFINSKNEIINASKLSIKVIGDCLIGINEKQETIVIEQYESEEFAKTVLKEVGRRILRFKEESGIPNYMIIDLRTWKGFYEKGEEK